MPSLGYLSCLVKTTTVETSELLPVRGIGGDCCEVVCVTSRVLGKQCCCLDVRPARADIRHDVRFVLRISVGLVLLIGLQRFDLFDGGWRESVAGPSDVTDDVGIFAFDFHFDVRSLLVDCALAGLFAGRSRRGFLRRPIGVARVVRISNRIDDVSRFLPSMVSSQWRHHLASGPPGSLGTPRVPHSGCINSRSSNSRISTNSAEST